MRNTANLTTQEVRDKGYFQGELKDFFQEYSGKQLNCSVCHDPFKISKDTVYFELHLPETLFEKIQSAFGRDVSRSMVSEETQESDLRVSNDVTAHGIIQCPQCKTGYGSHDLYWESLLE